MLSPRNITCPNRVDLVLTIHFFWSTANVSRQPATKKFSSHRDRNDPLLLGDDHVYRTALTSLPRSPHLLGSNSGSGRNGRLAQKLGIAMHGQDNYYISGANRACKVLVRQTRS
jgi:hypothetical protein